MSRKPLTEEQKQAARDRAKAWRLANLEKLKAPEYRAKRAAQARDYAKRNAEAISERQKIQRNEHPEKYRERSKKSAAKMRRERGDDVRAKKRAAYRKEVSNPDKKARRLEKSRASYAKNAEKIRQRYAERVENGIQWTEAQRKMRAEIGRKWQIENRDRVVAKCAERYAAKTRAMPKWVNRADLLRIYQQRETIARETGREYHVDHIVPLRGRLASGLHVPWNLRIIPGIENRRKSNKLVAL